MEISFALNQGRCNANMLKGTSKIQFHHVSLQSIVVRRRKKRTQFVISDLATNTNSATKACAENSALWHIYLRRLDDRYRSIIGYFFFLVMLSFYLSKKMYLPIVTVWYSPFSGCVFFSESIKVLIAFKTKIISVTCCLKGKKRNNKGIPQLQKAQD